MLGFRLAGIKRVYTVQPEDYEQKLLELVADSSIGILAINSADLEKLCPAPERRRWRASPRSWFRSAKRKATCERR